ncbi:Nucleotidylyl transferase [Aaosphaeria arxii CBS 175.79]|uniref:Nucleotidylyl transferase n=1 Tax=Aaosphaeria arxii CBS 175.79 TaxID=1450172 RepID=A0A6A5XZ33_9PLEO|nr:Nucleotidylyl transferase [Aaosphaeria arxii CBS 175.79]KAF2018219.1 Nucleotidylyl transferase [Aaosphaeria arxii CBS 175.79]
MAEMASRIAALKSQLPELESALHSFTNSSSKFRIVRTVNSTSTRPKTLYVLDSSFNPPSIAHLALSVSALSEPAPSDPKPHRFLLLFSTHNADKAPSPACFTQRLALMTLFAEDLSHILKTRSTSSGSTTPPEDISIDIGLTTEPYYTDKSLAIAESAPSLYSTNPTQVHLVGYDTLIRFCNPKYYGSVSPPLSALSPFFDAGHKLRVTERPADSHDESSSAYGTDAEQEEYLQGLKSGRLEAEGFKSQWVDQIQMVKGKDGVGISSTRVRKAAEGGRWEEVRGLCTEGVAEWVRDSGLYEDDASGKKMMG